MEPIGYLKAPIAAEQFAYTQKTLQAHGAQFQKANRDSADIWWIVFLPEGTRREKCETQVTMPKYTILLPDGYSFLFEAGTLSQHGTFTRDPAIFLDAPEEA